MYKGVDPPLGGTAPFSCGTSAALNRLVGWEKGSGEGFFSENGAGDAATACSFGYEKDGSESVSPAWPTAVG